MVTLAGFYCISRVTDTVQLLAAFVLVSGTTQKYQHCDVFACIIVYKVHVDRRFVSVFVLRRTELHFIMWQRFSYLVAPRGSVANNYNAFCLKGTSEKAFII
jgi:hypothetical protein